MEVKVDLTSTTTVDIVMIVVVVSVEAVVSTVDVTVAGLTLRKALQKMLAMLSSNALK